MDVPVCPVLGHGGVLALDLSRVTGWCYGAPGCNLPEFGSWLMPLAVEGARYAALDNELTDAFAALRPSHVIIEAPIALPAMTNRAAMWQQLGMRAIVRAAAWRDSVSVSEVSAEIVRNELLGFSRVPGKPGAIKFHCIRWCRRNGIHVTDDHQADAVFLWEWRRRRVSGEWPRQRKLFEAA